MITLVSSEWQDSGDCQFERFWPNSVSQTREVLTIFQHNNVKSRAQEPNVMPFIWFAVNWKFTIWFFLSVNITVYLTLFWAGFLDVKYGRDVELATLVIFWGIRPISFKIYTVAIET